MATNALKIIVIDNNLEQHETYSLYFENYYDYVLTGAYSSVEQALMSFSTVKPDIIVSKVNLPGISGIDGIRLFRKKDKNVKIIMISAHNEFDIVKAAFKNGASGYLTEPISQERLHNALDAIKYQGAIISNDIAKKVISMFQRKNFKAFSERENQIIDYLFQGATYKMIAQKLFVTTSAVNFHIQNIYLKLNVNSKSEALNKLQQLQHS